MIGKPKFERRVLILSCLFLICISPTVNAATGQIQTTGVDAYLTQWNRAGRFNGVVLVAADGQIIFEKGYGMSNRELGVPNGPESRFEIRSITKQFTTVMILQLASEGKVNLNAKLTDYLPKYRKATGSQVTIDNLLRHTSGIPCYLNDLHIGPDGAPRFSLAERHERTHFVDTWLSGDLLFEPGSEYRYSNSGYFLLAMIIEEVTGKSYEDNLNERILKPLKMENTGIAQAWAIIRNRADGYVKTADRFTKAQFWDLSNLFGAGNLYSTAQDLLRWNLALDTDELLDMSNRERMQSVYFDSRGTQYAYSLNYFRQTMPDGTTLRYTGFSGGGKGFATDVFRFVDDGVIVIILANSSQYNHWKIGPDIYKIIHGFEVDQPRPLLSDILLKTVARDGCEAAKTKYDELMTDHPKSFESGALEREINAHGYALLMLEETKMAIEVFRLNVLLFADSWNTYDSLAEAYFEAGEPEASERNYRIAKKLRSDNRALMQFVSTGHWTEAKTAIAALHKENPDSQLLQPSQIGPIFEEFMSSEDFDSALALGRVWAQANPESVGPWFSLARVHKARANTEMAKACYLKIIEIEPEGPAADAARRNLK